MTSKLRQFTITNVILAISLLAVALSWWVDHRNLTDANRRLDFRARAGDQEFDKLKQMLQVATTADVTVSDYDFYHDGELYLKSGNYHIQFDGTARELSQMLNIKYPPVRDEAGFSAAEEITVTLHCPSNPDYHFQIQGEDILWLGSHLEYHAFLNDDTDRFRKFLVKLCRPSGDTEQSNELIEDDK
jgi:hypothetical protein